MVAAGHNPSDVWGYTPRQLMGYYELASKRELANRALDLEIQALVASQNFEEMKKIAKEWRGKC